MKKETVVESFGSVGDLCLTEAFDKAMEQARVDEGIAKAIALGSLLCIPFFADAKDIEGSLPKGQTTYTRSDIKKAMEKSYKLKRVYGGVQASNVCNMVAKTLWMEARGEGDEGMKAVLSVILNRCGGDPDNTIKVLKKHKAFSCWNGYEGGWTDSSYDFFEPSSIRKSASSEELWRTCNELSSKFLAGEFKSTVGNFNSYLNKATADKENVEGWGKKCKLRIGKHHFGYLPENDGYKEEDDRKAKEELRKRLEKPLGITVVVKKGDSLEKIAKKNGITVAAILERNPKIKDRNKIRRGQKLSL